MGKNLASQKGFSPLMIIVIIAAVAIAGLIAWRIYDTIQGQQQANTTGNQQQEQSSQSQQQDPITDPNEGYIVIEEWGVRFKPAKGLEGVRYSVGTIEGADGSAHFSTEALAEYGDPCTDSQTGMAPLGKLIRTLGSKDSAIPISTNFDLQINDYYYQYVTPQSVCSDDNVARDLQTQTLSLFKSSIQSLEIAQ